jgi:hypothetical protein
VSHIHTLSRHPVCEVPLETYSYEPSLVDHIDYSLDWCITDVALQQRLGLLPERCAGPDLGHTLDPCSARKALIIVVVARSPVE